MKETEIIKQNKTKQFEPKKISLSSFHCFTSSSTTIGQKRNNRRILSLLKYLFAFFLYGSATRTTEWAKHTARILVWAVWRSNTIAHVQIAHNTNPSIELKFQNVVAVTFLFIHWMYELTCSRTCVSVQAIPLPMCWYACVWYEWPHRMTVVRFDRPFLC